MHCIAPSGTPLTDAAWARHVLAAVRAGADLLLVDAYAAGVPAPPHFNVGLPPGLDAAQARRHVDEVLHPAFAAVAQGCYSMWAAVPDAEVDWDARLDAA